jgi:hypothetical protein
MAFSEKSAIIRVGGLASADENAAAVGYAVKENPAPEMAARWVSWPRNRVRWPRRSSSAAMPRAGGTFPPPSHVTKR